MDPYVDNSYTSSLPSRSAGINILGLIFRTSGHGHPLILDSCSPVITDSNLELEHLDFRTWGRLWNFDHGKITAR